MRTAIPGHHHVSSSVRDGVTIVRIHSNECRLTQTPFDLAVQSSSLAIDLLQKQECLDQKATSTACWITNPQASRRIFVAKQMPDHKSNDMSRSIEFSKVFLDSSTCKCFVNNPEKVEIAS